MMIRRSGYQSQNKRVPFIYALLKKQCVISSLEKTPDWDINHIGQIIEIVCTETGHSADQLSFFNFQTAESYAEIPPGQYRYKQLVVNTDPLLPEISWVETLCPNIITQLFAGLIKKGLKTL